MIADGLLVAVGNGGKTGEAITKEAYDTILEVIRNAPTAPEGYGYRLTAGQEWELYELHIVEDEETEV